MLNWKCLNEPYALGEWTNNEEIQMLSGSKIAASELSSSMTVRRAIRVSVKSGPPADYKTRTYKNNFSLPRIQIMIMMCRSDINVT